MAGDGRGPWFAVGWGARVAAVPHPAPGAEKLAGRHGAGFLQYPALDSVLLLRLLAPTERDETTE